MANKNLAAQTKLADSEIDGKKQKLGTNSFYCILASKEKVLTYYWSGAKFQLLVTTDFKSVLDPSSRLEDSQGRRQSDKESHRQGMAEEHSESSIPMTDLIRTHRNELEERVHGNGKPSLYRSVVKVFVDPSHMDAFKQAFSESAAATMKYYAKNLIAAEVFNEPSSWPAKQKLIFECAKIDDSSG